MNRSCFILAAAACASAVLSGCERGASVGVGVVNKTGMMITNCILQFDEGTLNTGVVLTNGRREFSYFSKPISESVAVEVVFPDGARRTMRAHVGAAYDPAKSGTLLFEIGPEAVRVAFHRAK